MQPPAPEDQIRFLTNVQRLLAEGLFTATYKYALIAALADLSVALVTSRAGRCGCPRLRLRRSSSSTTGGTRSLMQLQTSSVFYVRTPASPRRFINLIEDARGGMVIRWPASCATAMRGSSLFAKLKVLLRRCRIALETNAAVERGGHFDEEAIEEYCFNRLPNEARLQFEQPLLVRERCPQMVQDGLEFICCIHAALATRTRLDG